MRFDAGLETTLQRALAEALGPLSDRTSGIPRVAVAYSGGGDSTALLHAAAMLQRRRLIEVFAFHIHHGIADDADQWLSHCADRAAAFGVAFDGDHVTPLRHGVSLEADARRLRYAALVRLCKRRGCGVLMTAHHADDQAETVLLNLARGAGIGGLAATARSRTIDDVLLLRPLIDVPSTRLRDHLRSNALAHVDDPSNSDRRFTRNAIRHEVMPALRRIVPTIATRLAQTATHAATMQSLLDEIGAEDLAGERRPPGSADSANPTDADDALDVDRLAGLSDARAANALRVWLARRGMRPPSAAALKEMLDQLLHASPDAQIELLHERQTLRVYRNRLSIDRGGAPRSAFRSVAWRGESEIVVPEWSGTLRFVATADRGFDALALREGPLALRERRGGERLRLRVDGPSRTLKNLYQESGIASWRRGRLPLVYLGDRLLFAAGIGANASMLVDAMPGTEVVTLEWAGDRPPADLLGDPLI